MKSTRGLLVLSLPLVALLFAGCPFSPKAKPPVPIPKYPEQSSPQICLTILQKTYVDRDIEEYKALFTSDFTFVFYANDVTGPEPTPAQWDWTAEMEATQNIFQSELVSSITLSFDEDDPVQSTLYPGKWKVEATNIQLRLETRKPDGSQLTVAVPGGHCTFFFQEFPNERTSKGEPIWRIWRWEDQGISSKLLAQALKGR